MTHAKPVLQLSDFHYPIFRDLIQSRTGLLFGPQKRDTFSKALSDAAHHAYVDDLVQYLLLLQNTLTDSLLWDNLIKNLTISETYFFRDPAYIVALQEIILPELIVQHQQDRRLRLWSAGCSTGEEPYTLAMLLNELIPDQSGWDILIMATDINRQSIKLAQAGEYRSWSFRQTNLTMHERYFIKHQETFALKPEIRKRVSFAYLNMAENDYPSAKTNTYNMDLILWRNVSIYLPKEVTRQIADRFYNALTPQGWLMVGPSEVNTEIYHQYNAVLFSNAIIYQKSTSPTKEQPEAASPLGTSQFNESANFKPILPVTHLTLQPLSKEKTVIPAPLLNTSPASKSSTEFFTDGLDSLIQHRFDEAKQHFIRCIDKDIHYHPAYLQLARLEANLGHLDEAEKWVVKTIEQDPLQNEAHYMLALIYQEQDKQEEAIAEFKKALS